MHAVLQIEEVFLCIAEALDHNTPQARSALCALARTCKTLHEPTINVLWHTQTSLAPILTCVPGVEVYIMNTIDSVNRKFQVAKRQLRIRIPREDPQPDDWKRFDKYAGKIRRLQLGVLARREASDLIDHEVLVALHAARPISCFPQLRHLEWPAEGIQYTDEHYIAMFLGPMLSEVNLHTFSLSGYKEILGRFKETCPELKRLSFMCEPSPEMRDLFQGWTSLRSLNCSGFPKSTETWILPTLLPNLEILQLGALPINYLPPDRGYRDENPLHIYPSLRTFNLIVVSQATPHLDTLLSIVSCPRLETLIISLSMDDQPDEAFAKTFFSAISRMCSPRALQTLRITWNPFITGTTRWFEASIVHFDVLRPLLFFENIRLFSSDAFFLIDLDDAKMLEISQAWSSLVWFNLVPGRRVRHPRGQITLKAIEYLSMNCPQLEEFGAVIDSQLIPELPSTATDNPSDRCRLVSLSLVDSVVTDPESVAWYLSSLFPSLRCIFQLCVMDKEYSRYQGLWREVERLVREIRRQGK